MSTSSRSSLGQPKGTRPPTDLPPAQATVELFKPHARSCGQVKLLQSHLLTGNLPYPVHQTRADATTTE